MLLLFHTFFNIFLYRTRFSHICQYSQYAVFTHLILWNFPNIFDFFTFILCCFPNCANMDGI
ncbi:hypothetical protein CLOSTHATH_00458 [Hungatella hathewayi DSM 13479]|uniref:Uncharacterized protein n=1 Tax=Hungatella hathewayi DSM 13479 TaxID=566550 RepID=D3AA37_9FIRM|nr:hypothetical protein CLOSTHATH_00458 [Hungatella hathewayi DSM 13479]